MAKGKSIECHLWLDESGAFLEDTNTPSLVGGVYCREDQISGINPEYIIQQVADCPDFQKSFQENGTEYFRHCVELPDDVKVPARLLVMEACVKNGLNFVFFRPQRKLPIVDSTRTYLNFLAEGLAQFMASLSQYGNVKLHVTIGRRVDTEKMDQLLAQDETLDRDSARSLAGTIPEAEYGERFQERLALAKIRQLHCAGSTMACDLSFDSDKTNGFLILSDYVCSCRYNLDSNARYLADSGDGRTYRERIRQILQEHAQEYGLWEDAMLIEVRHSLASGNWGGALYQVLAGKGKIPEGEIRLSLLENFERLPVQTQRTQMEVFFQLADSLSLQPDTYNNAYNTIDSMMTVLLNELQALPFADESVRRFSRVNALLYRSTVRTHLGRSEESWQDLMACRADLPELLRRSEDRDLFYIHKNRVAVVMQDSFDYAGADQELRSALEVAEMEHAYLEELFQMFQLDPLDEYSTQRAKLLGSLTLNGLYWLPSAPETADTAIATAQAAVAAFQYPRDRQRHKNNLAVILALSGKRREAVAAFAEAQGCSPADLPQILSNTTDRYALYNAIRLADALWDGDPSEHSLALQLFQIFKRRASQLVNAWYPSHSIARRLGMLALSKAADKGIAKMMLDQCANLCFKSNAPGSVLWVIGMASLADRIVYKLSQETPQASPKPLPEEIKFQSCYEKAMEALNSSRDTRMAEFFESLGPLPQADTPIPARIAYFDRLSKRVGH